MRNKVWYGLSNVYFKAEYSASVSKYASTWGNVYSFFLAFASAASVGAWATWEKYPVLWASIVAVSQVMHIAKPYIPFLKQDKEYLEMSYKFRFLFLEYERLWHELENGILSDDEITEEYFKLQRQAVEIDQAHKQSQVPVFKSLIVKASQETKKSLGNMFT